MGERRECFYRVFHAFPGGPGQRILRFWTLLKGIIAELPNEIIQVRSFYLTDCC